MPLPSPSFEFPDPNPHAITNSTVLIGMGSNVSPGENLASAAAELRRIFPGTVFSNVYASAPLERSDQPPFLNACARIRTSLPPDRVKTSLESIETELKKAPPFRFGPRTIDLDLLLYDDLVLPSKESWLSDYPLSTIHYPLLVPHPRMHERRFVLEPLLELVDVNSVHPVLGIPWTELLKKTDGQTCEKNGLTL